MALGLRACAAHRRATRLVEGSNIASSILYSRRTRNSLQGSFIHIGWRLSSWDAEMNRGEQAQLSGVYLDDRHDKRPKMVTI